MHVPARPLLLLLALAAAGVAVSGCQEMKKKEAEEAAKNTFASSSKASGC